MDHHGGGPYVTQKKSVSHKNYLTPKKQVDCTGFIKTRNNTSQVICNKIRHWATINTGNVAQSDSENSKFYFFEIH